MITCYLDIPEANFLHPDEEEDREEEEGLEAEEDSKKSNRSISILILQQLVNK